MQIKKLHIGEAKALDSKFCYEDIPYLWIGELHFIEMKCIEIYDELEKR